MYVCVYMKSGWIIEYLCRESCRRDMFACWFQAGHIVISFKLLRTEWYIEMHGKLTFFILDIIGALDKTTWIILGIHNQDNVAQNIKNVQVWMSMLS